MKNKLAQALVLSLLTTALSAMEPKQEIAADKHSLEKAIDKLKVAQTQAILDKKPLTENEAIRLIDRLMENKASHQLRFFVKSLIANAALGAAVGYGCKKTLFKDALNGTEQATLFGGAAGLAGLALSPAFFPSNKYRMLLGMLSKPLSREQLTMLGVYSDQVTITHQRSWLEIFLGVLTTVIKKRM